MSDPSRAVISRGNRRPLTVEPITVPDPGPLDVVVKVVACGVCHSDLGASSRDRPDGSPMILGHEVAGRVEEVGANVTNVALGDTVIVAWRAPCGQCVPCQRGFAQMCEQTLTASVPMTLEDGTVLGTMLGIGGFADRICVAAAQCVPFDPSIRPESAALIGCGVMTGFGAATNAVPVRPGDSVAVFGCGGVGDAAIAGAAFSGASVIIAVDTNPIKLSWARQFGATDFVDASSVTSSEEVRRITGGRGADVVIEAVGTPAAYLEAFRSRSRTGTLVQVGVPMPGMEVTLSMRDLFERGPLRASWYGECIPTRDFPVLLDLYTKGRLDLDAFVTETIGIDDVPAAFAKIEAGTVLRSVVVL